MKYLSIVLMVLLTTVALADTQGGKRFVVLINQWSGGMHPVVGPYGNPNTIAYTKNFIASQPNGIHLRSGYSGLLPDPVGTAPTDTTTAVAVFAPSEDSTYVVYTAGGIWYGNQAGILKYRPTGGVVPGAPEIDWRSTLVAEERINPRNTGDSLTLILNSSLITGFNTRFIRDLSLGDSLYLVGDPDTIAPRAVKHIYSDTRLQVDAALRQTQNITTWTATRRYTEGVGAPYLHQGGNFLYTGNIATPPQVIYNQNDSLFMRELGIVDSFFIDSFYYFSGRFTFVDTCGGAGAPYTVDTSTNPLDLYTCGTSGDSLCSLGVFIDDFRTWDTTFLHGYRNSADYDTFNVFLRTVQVVSRRKAWASNEWREAISGAPEAFYVRIGNNASTVAGNARYFTVAYNDDTSLFLNNWIVTDTSINYTASGATDSLWKDSLFLGRGLDFDDTLAVSNYVGQWGYIYTTAGAPEVIVDDEDTEKLYVHGLGSFCYTVDPTFPVDTLEIANGMTFLRLTSGDIEFRGFTEEIQNERVEIYYKNPDDDAPVLEESDSLLDSWRVYAVFNLCGGIIGNSPCGEPLTEYFDSRLEAKDAAKEMGCSPIEGDCGVASVTVYKIRRGKNRAIDFESAWLTEGSAFPIRYAQKNGDTTFFVTGVSLGLTLDDIDSTSNWELVRARLPKWREMLGSERGAGLIAWGDTLAPATISVSPGYNPWRFSALTDLTVGNPSVPLTAVASYDNQILGFKRNSITSATTGEGLSDGLGAVGRKAVAVQDKMVFFGAEDGVYQMDRRDYYGYSIQPISRSIDPIYQDWVGIEWGNNTVPINIARGFLDQLSLVVNPRDHRLWMWLPTDASNGGLGTAMTYNYESGVWDGYHNIPVGGIDVAVVRDTTRIIFGSVDSAYVFMMDYSYNDNGTGIDGDIHSKPFVLRDDNGRKVYAQLESVILTTRSLPAAYDSAKFTIYVLDNTAGLVGQTFDVAGQASYVHKTSGSNTTEKFYAGVNGLQGREWSWRLQVWGKDASYNVFMPIEVEVEWVAVEDR